MDSIDNYEEHMSELLTSIRDRTPITDEDLQKLRNMVDTIQEGTEQLSKTMSEIRTLDIDESEKGRLFLSLTSSVLYQLSPADDELRQLCWELLTSGTVDKFINSHNSE